MTTGQITRALPAVISSLEDDEEFSTALVESGLQTQSVASLYEVAPESAGLDGATTAIIVAFAPIANHVAKSLWDRFVERRFRSIEGEDSLGERRHDDPPANDLA